MIDSGASMAVRDLLGDERFVAVDFGARGGVPAEWFALASVAQVVCIEGDSEAAERLRTELRGQKATAGWIVVSEFVTGTGGRRRLYLTNARSGSSLFDPLGGVIPDYTNAEYLMPIQTLDVESRRASEVLNSLGQTCVDFAKLDIQGCELEVMQDLFDLHMAQMCGVAIEMAMQDKGPSHPRFEHVHTYLLEGGYELFDLSPVRVHRALRGSRGAYRAHLFPDRSGRTALKPRIWEVDGLYFRKLDSIWRSEDVVGALRRLLVSYGLYGFFAEAHFAADTARERGVIDRGEFEGLEAALRRWYLQCPLPAGRSRWWSRLRAVFRP